MKNLLLALVQLFLACGTVGGAENPPQTPAAIRAALMLRALGPFSEAVEGSETGMAVMRKVTVDWTIKWQKPREAHWQFNAAATSKQMIDIAVEWGAKNLPELIRPRQSQLAYVMCLQLDPEKDRWIWVLDFHIDAQEVSAGSPCSLLPIAITPAGEVITVFSEVNSR